MTPARLETIRNPRLREEIVSTRLSNGLRAHVFPKPGLQKKVAIFATQYGSIDLVFSPTPGSPPAPTPPGIAHFLEHQLFKKQDVDVLMEFGKFGATSNAFTDYTSTTYYFSGTERFEESLELLVRLVFAPHFTVEGVAKEKLIIEQELRMYDDMPDYRVYKNLMAAMYRDHPVRIDIGGSVASIQDIDRDLLDRCYRRFYHPTNMWFVACGDLDPAPVFDQVERLMAAMEFGAGGPIARNYPVEPPEIGKALVRDSAVVSRSRGIVGFKDLEIGGSDLLERELAMSVLTDLVFGPTSAFHSKWYAQGLIDDSFSVSYNAETEFGFTLAGGETDEPEKLAEEVRKELRRAMKTKLKKRDVERAKRKRQGRFLRSFDSPDGVAFLLLGSLMRGIDVFSIPKHVARLTPSRLEERLRRHVAPDRFTLSIVDPKK